MSLTLASAAKASIHLCVESSAGVPAVHKLLPAVKVKWFSSESPGLCSGQNSIGLQTNCSSLSQKQETTISRLVGSGLGDRQCCSVPAAICLQLLAGSSGSPCRSDGSPSFPKLWE